MYQKITRKLEDSLPKRVQDAKGGHTKYRLLPLEAILF